MMFFPSQHCPSLVLLLFLLFILSSSSSSSSSFSVVVVVEATNVQWQGNDNVPPAHRAAHTAPRSQKYWDEHGIERPEYAMTDAEIIAKRRRQQNDGRSGDDGDSDFGPRRKRRLFGLVCKLLIVVVAAISIAVLLSMIVYANVTGDWDAIMKIPVASSSLAHRIVRWMLSAGGISGHRLGSSTTTTTTTITNLSTQGSRSHDEESRRLARLARFDNPKNMLDDNNVKMD